MVDFMYRPTFFLFVAAISALHRHFMRKQEAQMSLDIRPITAPLPWLRRPPLIDISGITLPGLPIPIIGGALMGAPAMASTALQPATATLVSIGNGSTRLLPWHRQPEPVARKRPRYIRDRLYLLDIPIMLACTYAAVLYWKYLIATM
jgi:hypothetical protein